MLTMQNDKIKILFDYQAFNQRIGGVSRYYIELMKNFSDQVDTSLSLIFSDNIYLPEVGTKYYSVFPQTNTSVKRKVYKTVNMLSSLYSIKYNKYDILHPTFLNPYFVEYTHKPVVVTIHDLNHDKFPNMLPKSSNVIEKERKIVKRADAIIAISEETKNDLVRYHDVPEEKITVVYHGIEQTPINCNQIPIMRYPYLLYVGGRYGYKNFSNFLRAFQLVEADIHLVCTGVNFTNDEQKLVSKLGIEKRIHQMFVTNDELNNLMCNALAFVYPSIGEGFGLPILEAYRCSCPCIISDLQCFHEVSDNAAAYFNPYSVDDIAYTINKTISDSEQLTHLKQLGAKRMKKFTWKNTAVKTETVYRKML